MTAAAATLAAHIDRIAPARRGDGRALQFLDDPSAVWIVRLGEADLFHVRMEGGEDFTRGSLDALAEIRRAFDLSEAERLARRAESLAEEAGTTLQRFNDALEARRRPRKIEGMDPLVAACTLVARAQGLTITDPPKKKNADGEDVLPTLPAISRASKLRTRQVALRGIWWTQDNVPLLAQREADKAWVALIPSGARAYQLHDPVDGSVIAVDDSVAETLAPFAHTLHGGLPDRAVTLPAPATISSTAAPEMITSMAATATTPSLAMSVTTWSMAAGATTPFITLPAAAAIRSTAATAPTR